MARRMAALKEENKEMKNPAGDASLSMMRTIDFGHGKIEKRTYWYTQSIDWMLDAKKDCAWLLVKMVCVGDLYGQSVLSEALWL